MADPEAAPPAAELPRRVQADPRASGPAAGHPPVPRGEAAQAAPPARPPRPQPVRGRHGEVHRLRAVRRRVPGRLHLRARPRQPAGPSGVARRALRLRLRDQLPALHPLRPVRGGLPHRGHHRVEVDGVLLHQPQRRHLHQGRAAGRRRRQSPTHLPWEDWREGDDLHTSGWMRATSPSGSAEFEGRVQWSGELGFGVRPPRAASPPSATTPPPAAGSCATPSSGTSARATCRPPSGAPGAPSAGCWRRPSGSPPAPARSTARRRTRTTSEAVVAGNTERDRSPVPAAPAADRPGAGRRHRIEQAPDGRPASERR